MKKRILFVCKHNLFRSQVAEYFFKKYNANKNFEARSAGVIKWDLSALKKDSNYRIEYSLCKQKGIKLKNKSDGLDYNLLKEMDLVVIVADDVPKKIFQEEKSFKGKILVWKISDVKEKIRNKKQIATETIDFIEKRVKKLILNL